MYRQKRESEYEKKIIYIKKRSQRPSSTSLSWCPEQDSNLHASRHAHLKRARLPFRHLGMGKKKEQRTRVNVSTSSPRFALRAETETRCCFNLELVSCSTSGKRDSNSRPQPWQGCALPPQSSASTNSATSPTNVVFSENFTPQ